jgi:putative copper export protein
VNLGDVARSYSIVELVIGWLRPVNEAARIFALARCPSCHARPRLAVIRAFARIAVNVVAGLAVATGVVALLLWLDTTRSDIGFSGAVMLAVFALYVIPLVFGVVAVLGEITRFGHRVGAAARDREPLPEARVL